jgi:hypothetical protein
MTDAAWSLPHHDGSETFHRHPDRYDAWWNLKEMPIFDHRSAELRRRLYAQGLALNH